MKSFYINFSIILISCLGIIVYSNTFHCSFHFDDIPFILDNFAIREFQHLRKHLEFPALPFCLLSFSGFKLSFPPV